jgi:hypothetical protein
MLQVIIIVAGALIPIVNTFTLIYMTLGDTIAIISAVLGGIVVICVATLQLTKLRESVMVFRIIGSRLQREYHSFIQGIDNYSRNDSTNDIERKDEIKQQEKIFKQNSESLIFNSTAEYYDLFRDSKKEHQLNNKINNQ